MDNTVEDDENRLMQSMGALTLSEEFNSSQTNVDVAFGIRNGRLVPNAETIKAATVKKEGPKGDTILAYEARLQVIDRKLDEREIYRKRLDDPLFIACNANQ